MTNLQKCQQAAEIVHENTGHYFHIMTDDRDRVLYMEAGPHYAKRGQKAVVWASYFSKPLSKTSVTEIVQELNQELTRAHLA